MNRMAEADILESDWKNLRPEVGQNWKAFTREDLDQIAGHFDVLVELLQEKYGYSKALAEDDVKRFIREHRAEQVR